MNRFVTLFVALFIGAMVISSTVYVVDQRRYAMVFSFGKMVGHIMAAGYSAGHRRAARLAICEVWVGSISIISTGIDHVGCINMPRGTAYIT